MIQKDRLLRFLLELGNSYMALSKTIFLFIYFGNLDIYQELKTTIGKVDSNLSAKTSSRIDEEQ